MELLSRVDIVPPSLAVAQAAEETGWGTSRFVRRGNALFGERSYKSSDGMVPQRIPPGDNFRIRRFGQLLAAVDSYVSNLNTHPAYAAFRARRSEMRAAEGRFNATALAGDLEAYSVRRQAYVETVRAIIRTNEAILRDRKRVERLRSAYARHGSLPAGAERWLWHVFAAYKVEPFDFVELLSRVDIVPPSLSRRPGRSVRWKSGCRRRIWSTSAGD